MNFQQIEQGRGNLVQMFGVFTNIGGLEYTPQQKAKAMCKIKDDVGTEHSVHIYQGKGQLPTQQQLNQRCQFTLSTFQGTYQNRPYTGYSGFWNSDTSRQPQQPLQAPQSPNSKKEVDWDAKECRSHRAMCTAYAKDLVVAGKLDLEAMDSWVKAKVAFIWDGLVDRGGQPNPNYVGDNPPPPVGDDIPF